MPFGTAFRTAKKWAGVMSKNIKSKSAASTEMAGYSTALPDAASAWQQYCSDPGNGLLGEHLAIEIDALLKRRLPRGRLAGVLLGREEEVRQEAYLLLVGKYLAGNADLMAATAGGNRLQIMNQIHKCVGGSIKSVSLTIKKALKRHLEWHVYGTEPQDCPQATCVHPSWRKHLCEISFEEQRALVFGALAQAVRKKLLRARSARIAMDMVDRRLNQRKIARSLGISRQAVHRLLAPVRKHLPAIIENQEFPLT
jgi:transposase-like protein